MFSYTRAQSVLHENVQPFIAVVTSLISVVGSSHRSQAPSNLLQFIYKPSPCHVGIVATDQPLCTSLFAEIGGSARLLGGKYSFQYPLSSFAFFSYIFLNRWYCPLRGTG